MWVAWQQAGRVQRPHLPALDGELAPLLAERDGDRARDRDPGRVRARLRHLPGPQADPDAHARRDDHAAGDARAPDLPRAVRGAPVGSPLSIILPFAFFPFGVYLAYLYYATALPPDLLDAARVDGCGEWAVFRRIGLPLAKPIVAFVFFFSFVANWNNFFLPFVFLGRYQQFPVQVGLQDLFRGSRPALALATLLAALPVALVYVFSQRALVRGLVSGASKG